VYYYWKGVKMAVIKVNGKVIPYHVYEDIIKPLWKEKMRKEKGDKNA